MRTMSTPLVRLRVAHRYYASAVPAEKGSNIMTDVRSHRCVFISHCLLAQGIMAQGIVRKYPAVVRPLIEFCIKHDLNILQMPCPESRCSAGGLVREPHGKHWYEQNGLRASARTIAVDQVNYMRALVDEGFEIFAIIGVDFSPACAVNYLNRGPAIYSDQGIYVEELQKCLHEVRLDVPFVGVNQRWHKKLLRDLNNLVSSELAVNER